MVIETVKNMCTFVVCTVTVDGLAPSAGTVMTKFGCRMYKKPKLQWLIALILWPLEDLKDILDKELSSEV